MRALVFITIFLFGSINISHSQSFWRQALDQLENQSREVDQKRLDQMRSNAEKIVEQNIVFIKGLDYSPADKTPEERLSERHNSYEELVSKSDYFSSQYDSTIAVYLVWKSNRLNEILEHLATDGLNKDKSYQYSVVEQYLRELKYSEAKIENEISVSQGYPKMMEYQYRKR